MQLLQPKKAIFLPLFHQREFNILERQNEVGDDCFVAQFHDTPGNSLDQKYMSLNLSKNHYSVLSMSGFREKIFDFTAEVEQYGQPVQVSNNAQIIVFLKYSETSIEKYPSISLLRITKDGLKFMKTINLTEKFSE